MLKVTLLTSFLSQINGSLLLTSKVFGHSTGFSFFYQTQFLTNHGEHFLPWYSLRLRDQNSAY